MATAGRVAVARLVDSTPNPPASPGVASVRSIGARRRLADTDIGMRLLARLDAATTRPSVATVAALRAAVTDVVDRMKALDLPLDRTLGVIDGLASGYAAATRARLLDWCARAYRDDEWW